MTAGPDRGSVSLLVLGLALPVAIVGMGLVVAIAQLGVARAAAQGAADAAALAAAPITFHPFGGDADPGAVATAVATANGVELVACECRRDPTWSARVVVVRVARPVEVLGVFGVEVTASAAAEFTPVDLLR
ncbi:MAG: pilus assembly protein TadG-related protein [Acidimicrobiia bacterium]